MPIDFPNNPYFNQLCLRIAGQHAAIGITAYATDIFNVAERLTDE
jgi:hypothetical protein